MALPERQSARQMNWNPMSEIERIREEFDRLLGAVPSPLGDSGFAPSAALEETDDSYEIDIELPGVKREDVDIELSGRRLRVSGERKDKERTGLVRRSTRTTGQFRYELLMPGDIDEGSCKASFDDGVLTITVPKAEKEQARKIEIS